MSDRPPLRALVDAAYERRMNGAELLELIQAHHPTATNIQIIGTMQARQTELDREHAAFTRWYLAARLAITGLRS